MKNGSEPINIYSFSYIIRIRIQNWTKTTPKPNSNQFKNKRFFPIIGFLLICIWAAASAKGPLNHNNKINNNDKKKIKSNKNPNKNNDNNNKNK